MAAEDEGRTEEPSEYRIEKERKEGRVAKSQEISAALVILFAVLILVFLAKFIFAECMNIYRYFFERCAQADLSDKNMYSVFLSSFFKIILPITSIGILAGVIGNIVQTRGFLFSWKPIQPKFDKIIPRFGEYFKNTLFSGSGLFNLAKNFTKVLLICLVAYIFIRKDIFVLIQVIDNGQILQAIGKIASMAAQILIIVSVIFLLISIPDYFVQRREFREKLKMTKQEVKQEYKELEGDPEVKSRLRSMQQQLLKMNIPRAVKEADVVIANPTHYAVTLKYDMQQENSAPMMTAKGEDSTALYIRRLAEENNKPVIENRPVARELYTNLEVGDIIPEKYYRVIAEIYAQIKKEEITGNL